MNKSLLPLSAALLMLPLTTAFAQSVSSSSTSSALSAGSMSSMSSSLSSNPMSSQSSSWMSSSSRSSLSSAQRVYDTSGLGRYTDVTGWDQSTRVAVSVLTDAGVLQGDPAGTYRANSTLNRAEFVQIIMRLLPASDNRQFQNCFPDVARNVWYEAPVCRAKSMGIVRGNVNTQISPEKWPFEPNRAVQYEEAVKVLVKLYAFPAVERNGNDWYVPFINAALDRDLDLPGVIVGDKITRGEMARLAANFLAYSEGDLDLLIAAQNRSSSSSRMSSSSSWMSSRSSSSSMSSRSSLSSMSSSIRSGTYDPLTDTSVRSNFALLGQTTPVLAGAKFFSNNEPMNVNMLEISLTSPVSSIDSFLVYDQDGRQLGTAVQQGSSNVYRVSLATGVLTLPRREDHSVYLRARLKNFDSGGVSGQTVQVATIQVTGTGEWSNDAYSSSSSDVFPAFATARAAITSLTNAGQANALLGSGQDQLLANFAVATTATDGQADVILQQIRMQIQATGGVTVNNVELRQEGSDVGVACTISSTTITCGSIPENFGNISGTENFRVYGDVTVPSNANNPSLTLVINQPGSPTVAGDITWSDGTSSFTWVMGNAPLVRGTQFQ